MVFFIYSFHRSRTNDNNIPFDMTSEEIQKVIYDCPHLKSFCLHYNRTKEGTLDLKGLKQLRDLDLTGCVEITNECLHENIKNLKQLQTLILPPHTTDKVLESLKDIPLRTLILRNGINVTGEGLKELTNLEFLDLGRCRYLTNKGLESIQAPNLKVLKLDNAELLTNEGIKNLERLTHLSGLTLDCTHLTDDAMESLSKLTMLSELILYNCQSLTDEGMEHLKNLSLEILHVYDCQTLSTTCKNYFKNKIPNFRVYGSVLDLLG
jgi:hypothetical protein